MKLGFVTDALTNYKYSYPHLFLIDTETFINYNFCGKLLLIFKIDIKITTRDPCKAFYGVFVHRPMIVSVTVLVRFSFGEGTLTLLDVFLLRCFSITCHYLLFFFIFAILGRWRYLAVISIFIAVKGNDMNIFSNTYLSFFNLYLLFIEIYLICNIVNLSPYVNFIHIHCSMIVIVPIISHIV